MTNAPEGSGNILDMLIVGAGISGVGAAWHLKTRTPGTSFLVLEEKETFGGTWVTHTYPGIRSDSDLYTFGYRFKPWVGPPIATAAEILSYMGEVIEEADLAPHIRYGHRILAADWSDADRVWRVEVERLADGERVSLRTRFLWMCQGYYNHKQGYTPDWAGLADYKGRVVHPQFWPDDLDLADKSVLVIGSGATAATLIPNIAGACRHVTMLQRSPTYFRVARNQIELADQLRELEIDETWIHEIVRRRILLDSHRIQKLAKRHPDLIRKELLDGVRQVVGDAVDVDRHFSPRYRPWQQRLAFVPDGDLFRAFKEGKASVETDEIERFTATGVQLKSGKALGADVVITATGFDLSVMGGIPFSRNGEPIDWARTVTYRGMMFTGVPNLVWVFGYFRASWTLRADMVADFVLRLTDDMRARGRASLEVALRREDAGMTIGGWIDEDDFNPNYLLRSQHLMPRAGSKPEWRHTQDYWSEKDAFPAIDLAGEEFVYG
jgi:cation diffusion facilitator CzcD-associated flavoprotein CzcO